MAIPRLSSVKAKIIDQNNPLKVALAAQAMESPLVQLPFSKKALYISEPAQVKEVWQNRPHDKHNNALDALIHKNFTDNPQHMAPWQPLLANWAQNDSLEIMVANLNKAVDAALDAWLNRKASFLKPTLDAPLLSSEICFDMLFATFFGKDPELERAMRTWLRRLLHYVNNAWIVSRYWPSVHRPLYLYSYNNLRHLMHKKIKKPEGYLKQILELNEKNSILHEGALCDFLLCGFLAAHQTLSNLLGAGLYHLAQSRGLFLLLQKEAIDTLGKVAPKNEDYGKLMVGTTVADEVLRLFPPVTWVSHKLKEALQVGDTLVAKGAFLYASPYAIQRDVNFWPTGENFDPAASFDDPARRENYFMPFAFLPGEEALEVIAGTFLTFALTRIAQTADLTLPLVNTPPGHEIDFGVKMKGETAVRVKRI